MGIGENVGENTGLNTGQEGYRSQETVPPDPPGDDDPDTLVIMNWQGDMNAWESAGDIMLPNGPGDEAVSGFRFVDNSGANVIETETTNSNWCTVFNSGILPTPNCGPPANHSINITDLGLSDEVGLRCWKKNIGPNDTEDWLTFDSSSYSTFWLDFYLKIPSNWNINGSGWNASWTNWKWMYITQVQGVHNGYPGLLGIKLKAGSTQQNASLSVGIIPAGDTNIEFSETVTNWITPSDAGTWRRTAIGIHQHSSQGYVQIWTKPDGSSNWTRDLNYSGVNVSGSAGGYDSWGIFTVYNGSLSRPNSSENMFWDFKNLKIYDHMPSHIS